MSIFSKINQFYKNITPKQFMLTGVFMLALAGAIGGGFASKQLSSAATGRDCTVNSIDNKVINGGCGATSPNELLLDIWAQQNPDLYGIYNHFGLSNLDYDRFLKTGRFGTAYQNGDVVVDGQVVMTNAWSIGRTGFSYSTPYPISGVGTYHKSMHTSVLKSNIPVLVLFDENGTVEFTVLTACGNPVEGNKKTSSASCTALNKTAVSGQENTFSFTTTVPTTGMAAVTKVQYFADGQLFATESSPSTAVTKAFTKDTTVTVKVFVKFPGNAEREIETINCKQMVTIKKKEVFHVCKNLVATSSDNVSFRFTIQTSQTQGVSVKSADFTLDGNATTTGVTPANGVIFRDYTFSDNVQHIVSIPRITFVVDGQDVVVTTPAGDCKASVTREKTPECKPGIPQGDTRCTECKPGVQVGSKECEELPSTGPAGTAGLFTGVSLLGAAAHRIFTKRRR